MILDSERKALSSAIRAFCVGRIRAREFEEAVELAQASKDEGVNAIAKELWYYYDDFRDHAFDSTPPRRAFAARCYVFLRSARRYLDTSPRYPWWGIVASVLTLGGSRWDVQRREIRFEGPWPFETWEAAQEAARTLCNLDRSRLASAPSAQMETQGPHANWNG